MWHLVTIARAETRHDDAKSRSLRTGRDTKSDNGELAEEQRVLGDPSNWNPAYCNEKLTYMTLQTDLSYRIWLIDFY